MSVALHIAIPTLRIFDVPKAREFYLDFLGSAWDWEHRFAPDAPLFAQISRGPVLLFLSEHFGDGTPGTHVLIRMAGLEALHADLTAKNYRHARPGIEDRPWGWRDVSVHDPFGNRITFSEIKDH
ncbi:VOC family protein [Roseomonas arctica]|uniref:Bleomycin resistance protein n=1 Tax=Plastoroseomonas arctica TaxID=1509237 RepID=A0AAF1K3V9_9PROT|nr:VOC family protein [Plastoroseomonas arctica]